MHKMLILIEPEISLWAPPIPGDFIIEHSLFQNISTFLEIYYLHSFKSYKYLKIW